MAWKGIVGQGYTSDGFGDYVESLTFGLWRPSFVVLHNTAVPRFAQWHDVPGTYQIHREDPLTTHIYPGNEISKTSFITQVTAKLTTDFPGEHSDMPTVA
jgi:hypothetical protein